VTVDTARDQATEARLLAAATELFAERGFANVTVRDICERAQANVAAINYHFRGKDGLYQAVLQSAIRLMQETTDLARKAGEGQTAEEQLRTYVRTFITRVVATRGNWIHQLMTRELADPTPVLDMVIAEVIKPRLAYLGGIVASLMGVAPADPRVLPCVFSVNAQCVSLLNHKGAARIDPAFAATLETVEPMVDHITAFSLAGIRAMTVNAAPP
jgi:TetR/AcrR family transcriptional regulator, regulator of cefoperazone and chloramphenicol sensitivity